MKKIALIEDRYLRQQLAQEEHDISLNNYADVVENIVEERYKSFVAQLKENEIDWGQYGAVAVHESAFGEDNTQMINRIKQACRTHALPLILFSGGTSVSHYDADPTPQITLNSREFYGHKLMAFFEHYKEHQKAELLILGYGKQWEIEIILGVKENIDRFLAHNTDDDVLFDEFTNETDLLLLDELSIAYPKPTIENGWVYGDALRSIATSINAIIKERVLYA